MTKLVRSFTTTTGLCAAEKLWRAFCQAARISTAPSLDLRAWTEQGADWLNRALPDVEGEPPVEIETTDRSRRAHLDQTRVVRVRGPRRPLEFSATFARSGGPLRGADLDWILATVHPSLLPSWTLVSASVDFGPAGSQDRAWAVLETFAGWAPGHADEWDLDDIADALSEVPELNVAFVEDDSVISAFLDETSHVAVRLRRPYRRPRAAPRPIRSAAELHSA